MFLQGVCLKAMRRGVKVVASYSTDETLCLEADSTEQINPLCPVTESMFPKVRSLGLTSMSSLTCSCWSLSSPKASMIKPIGQKNIHDLKSSDLGTYSNMVKIKG